MKYCAKCGNQLIDEATMCPKCGCMIEENSQFGISKSKRSNLVLRITSVFIILIGVLSIVLSIIMFCKYTGWVMRYESYNGDAYTGIQNASAQTARNIVTLCEIVKFGFGSVLLVFGLYLFFIGIRTMKQ